MIFASVGSMFPFDRLVRAVDSWADARGRSDVLVQIGNGSYIPRNTEWVRTLTPADYSVRLRECDLFVAHLGMGSLITGLQAKKPMLFMPRQRELGEHNTDHQIHGVDWTRARSGVWIADSDGDLTRLLDEFAAGKIAGPSDDIPAVASPSLITAVRRFIEAE